MDLCDGSSRILGDPSCNTLSDQTRPLEATGGHLAVRGAGVHLAQGAAVAAAEVVLGRLNLVGHLLAVDWLVGQQTSYLSYTISHYPPAWPCHDLLTPSVEEQHDDQQPEEKEEGHQHHVLPTDRVHGLPDGLDRSGEDKAGGVDGPGPCHSPQHHLVAGVGREARELEGGSQWALHLRRSHSDPVTGHKSPTGLTV